MVLDFLSCNLLIIFSVAAKLFPVYITGCKLLVTGQVKKEAIPQWQTGHLFFYFIKQEQQYFDW